jgi:hypothetical protein
VYPRPDPHVEQRLAAALARRRVDQHPKRRLGGWIAVVEAML